MAILPHPRGYAQLGELNTVKARLTLYVRTDLTLKIQYYPQNVRPLMCCILL
jgi:hypothetical protein